MSNFGKYDADFYAWAIEQAGLLRAGRLSEADIENIAEEIESMGRSEKRELVNRLEVLFAHLLKWQFQPDFRSNSWRNTIRDQRARIADHLDDNPSLRALLPAVIVKAYPHGIRLARKETGFGADTFPASCPWTFDEMMADDFFPD